MSPWLLVVIYVLVLGAFVGLELIGKLPPTLHVPLISATSGAAAIVLIAPLELPAELSGLSTGLSGAAIGLAAMAAVGGISAASGLLGSGTKEPR